MEDLTSLIVEVEPVDEHLMGIYEKIPEPFLTGEHDRLRALFLEVGGKLIAISQIRGE